MTNSAFGRWRRAAIGICASALALAAAAGLGLTGQVAEASSPLQGSTTVVVSPAELDLQCGQTAVVEIKINNVEDLFGVDIKVSYNPAILEVVDANPSTPGTQIAPGDMPDVSGGQGLVQVNTVDTAGGTVSYAAVRLNPAPAQSGSGKIASITFKGKAAGTSPISLVSAILADQTARAISAELVNSEATVACDGGPPATATPPSGGTPGTPPPSTPPPSSNCQYTVRPGDTLFSIARANGTTVSAIMALNKIYDADWIYAGQVLHLPGCGHTPPGGPHYPPSGPGHPPPGHYPPGKDCHTHIVKPGETLIGIALLSGDHVDALAKRNGIINPDLIWAGQPLQVCPGGHGHPGPGHPGPGHPGPGYPPAPACKFTHIVKPGETLFQIGWNYGLSVHSLAIANNLANPHLIYAGQVICIP
jgi:LysM repeat protein